jgi:hypothetical protein
MSNLINTLKKETESLRIQYLEMTKEWATKEFQTLRDWATQYQKGLLNLPPCERGPAEKKYYRLPYYIVNSNGKVEDHVSKMLKAAEDHYQNSILKLAARIEAKGLDQDNLRTETSHIGVNINTTLTDGNKTVRAFTIIASGEIQRPHYRYLIK